MRNVENRYLRDRAMDKAMDRARGVTTMSDMRRGSDYRGSDRRRGDGYDRRGDYRDRYGHSDYADYYEDGSRDYLGSRDYRRDYAKQEDDYEYKLRALTRKLEKNNKYHMTEQQVINQAKNEGVKFEEYDEEEFYVTFLMMCSDFEEISNDPNMFIKLAKLFLCDRDIPLTPAEKLCVYISEIAMPD